MAKPALAPNPGNLPRQNLKSSLRYNSNPNIRCNLKCNLKSNSKPSQKQPNKPHRGGNSNISSWKRTILLLTLILRLRVTPAIPYADIVDILFQHFPGPVRRVYRWRHRAVIGGGTGDGDGQSKDIDDGDRGGKGRGEGEDGYEGGEGGEVSGGENMSKEGETINSEGKTTNSKPKPRPINQKQNPAFRAHIQTHLQHKLRHEELNSTALFHEALTWESQNVRKVLKLCSLPLHELGLSGEGCQYEYQYKYQVCSAEEARVQALWRARGDWKVGSEPDEFGGGRGLFEKRCGREMVVGFGRDGEGEENMRIESLGERLACEVEEEEYKGEDDGDKGDDREGEERGSLNTQNDWNLLRRLKLSKGSERDGQLAISEQEDDNTTRKKREFAPLGPPPPSALDIKIRSRTETTWSCDVDAQNQGKQRRNTSQQPSSSASISLSPSPSPSRSLSTHPNLNPNHNSALREVSSTLLDPKTGRNIRFFIHTPTPTPTLRGSLCPSGRIELGKRSGKQQLSRGAGGGAGRAVCSKWKWNWNWNWNWESFEEQMEEIRAMEGEFRRGV